MSMRVFKIFLLSMLLTAMPAMADESPVSLLAEREIETTTSKSTPLTNEQSREMQAMLGFDVAIDKVIADALEDLFGLEKLTPQQSVCIKNLVDPTFRSYIDAIFIELFVDNETMAGWKAFAMTPSGEVFIDSMRANALAMAGLGPKPDIKATMWAMSEEQQNEIRLFLTSGAGSVLRKPFQEPELPPEIESELLARVRKQCQVNLDKL